LVTTQPWCRIHSIFTTRKMRQGQMLGPFIRVVSRRRRFARGEQR
jgi:hypothetical protein